MLSLVKLTSFAAKAPSPTFSNVDGILNVSNSQSTKACFPIDFTFANVALFKLLHPAKAILPIISTEVELTKVSFSQYPNAHSPISTTLSKLIEDVIPVPNGGKALPVELEDRFEQL